MKNKPIIIFFLGFVLFVVFSSYSRAHTDVTIQQAKDMIDADYQIIVVDVREEEAEFCGTGGHILGARNYPWTSGVLQQRYDELPTDAVLLVICRSGTRSNNAANFLDGEGYSNVYDALGGMNAWTWETVGCFDFDEPNSAGTSLKFRTEQIVQAGGVDINVPGYSVPSYVDWNNDGKKDLVIGQGGGGHTEGKVRVYLNTSTASEPQFSTFFYAQSSGSDLVCTASSSMGCFPRFVNWNIMTPTDLVVGLADGTFKVFLNTGTQESPTFDGGTIIEVGVSPSTEDANVGYRASVAVVDWDNDAWPDMVAGAMDGKIHVYHNCQCEISYPAFYTMPPEGKFALNNDVNLIVPQLCSSPEIVDLDGDGKKDILTGNTEGQLLFYRNVQTDSEPNFSGYTLVESNGVPIDLPGLTRSRPFVCDWTGDGNLDILLGAGDGKVHLYQGIPESGDMDNDNDVDGRDFSLFASRWGYADCLLCDGADLTGDGDVDANDLAKFAATWMSGVKILLYDFGLDTNPGWTIQGEWAFGEPIGGGGVPYPYPDPCSGYTGTNVYGVNLNGNYSISSGGPYWLTAGPFNCKGHNNIILKFARWLNTDDSYYVSVMLEVSNDGMAWDPVWENTGAEIKDNTWQLMQYDISSTTDNQQTVYIRWGYEVRAGAFAYSGWNIDDIQLWDYP